MWIIHVDTNTWYGYVLWHQLESKLQVEKFNIEPSTNVCSNVCSRGWCTVVENPKRLG